MRSWQKVIYLGLCNYVLLTGLHLIADLIAPWKIGLHVHLLMIVYPALMLKALPGHVYCLLTALVMGSLSPFATGSTLVCILFAYQLLILFKARLLPRSLGRLGMHCALLQFLIVLGLSFAFIPPYTDVTTYWIRCLSEAVLSASVVGLFSGLWFHWQGELIDEQGLPAGSPAKL